MLTLIYVLVTLASFAPFTLIVRYYSQRMNLDRVIEELVELSRKLESISPEKEKRLRVLRNRYSKLRRAISKLFFLNLGAIWLGVLVAILLSRLVVSTIAHIFSLPENPPSPIKLPVISYDGYLNVFILFIAIVLGYQAYHNKATGFSKLAKLRE